MLLSDLARVRWPFFYSLGPVFIPESLPGSVKITHFMTDFRIQTSAARKHYWPKYNLPGDRPRRVYR